MSRTNNIPSIIVISHFSNRFLDLFNLSTMAEVNQMGSGTLPSVQELFSLANKTAIVTGGTGGLGLSMAVALAEAGADIVSLQVPNDPRADLLAQAVKKLGRKLTSFDADVADSKSLRETFAKIWGAGIVPDILLNCAGINRRSKVEDFKDEDIDAVSHGVDKTGRKPFHQLRPYGGMVSTTDCPGIRNQPQSILCLCTGSWKEAH